jgi:hypothetical protein
MTKGGLYKIIKEIIIEMKISDKMFPVGFNRHNTNCCNIATEYVTKFFLLKGVKNFVIVHGGVKEEKETDYNTSWYRKKYNSEKEWEEGEGGLYDGLSDHTWIVFPNKSNNPPVKQFSVTDAVPIGRVFDPSKKQFGDLKLAYFGECAWTPEEYLKNCREYKNRNELI